MPRLLESRVRNERRMPGSVKGGERPAAARQYGVRRPFYKRPLFITRKRLLQIGGQWYGPRPPGEVKSRSPTATKEDVMQVVRIGLDLAKYVFEVHGVDSLGKVVVPYVDDAPVFRRFEIAVTS